MKGTLVVRWNGSQPTVELVSLAPDGTMHVDDVSRELAKASGRYAEAGLDGTEFDLSEFASNGRMKVRNTTKYKADDPAATLSSDTMSPARAAEEGQLPLPATRSLDLMPYAQRVAAQGVTSLPAQAPAPN